MNENSLYPLCDDDDEELFLTIAKYELYLRYGKTSSFAISPPASNGCSGVSVPTSSNVIESVVEVTLIYLPLCGFKNLNVIMFISNSFFFNLF